MRMRVKDSERVTQKYKVLDFIKLIEAVYEKAGDAAQRELLETMRVQCVDTNSYTLPQYDLVLSIQKEVEEEDEEPPTEGYNGEY